MNCDLAAVTSGDVRKAPSVWRFKLHGVLAAVTPDLAAPFGAGRTTGVATRHIHTLYLIPMNSRLMGLNRCRSMLGGCNGNVSAIAVRFPVTCTLQPINGSGNSYTCTETTGAGTDGMTPNSRCTFYGVSSGKYSLTVSVGGNYARSGTITVEIYGSLVIPLNLPGGTFNFWQATGLPKSY